MGLDVYLVRYPDGVQESLETQREFNRRRDALTKKLRKKYLGDADGFPSALRDKALELADELETDAFGEPLNAEEITLDSKLYPEHLWKIGYFRSSYNVSGFDSVVSRWVPWSLGTAFNNPMMEYLHYPDWDQCLSRTKHMRDEILAHIENKGAHSVFTEPVFSATGDTVGRDPTSALNLFYERVEKDKQYKDHPLSASRYSCSDGFFCHNQPLEVAALVKGVDFMGDPCIHVIYELSDSMLDYYTQATEIAVETCEWVLNTGRQDEYLLHWSG